MTPSTRGTVRRTTSRAASGTGARGSSGGPGRSARREATRTKLLAAAEQVFAERGFHGASVEDICERADFTRGAFYSNFSSKEELVLDLLDRHTSGVLERIAATADNPGLSLEEVLEEVFRAVDDRPTARRQWHLLVSEFELHALRDAKAGTAWAKQQRAVRAELGQLVERLAAQRGLRLTVPTAQFVAAAVAIVNAGPAEELVEPQPGGTTLARATLPLLVQGSLAPDHR